MERPSAEGKLLDVLELNFKNNAKLHHGGKWSAHKTGKRYRTGEKT